MQRVTRGVAAAESAAAPIRIPRARLVLAAVWTASALVLAAVAGAAAWTDRPIADFTRDPTAALQTTTCNAWDCAYIGFLSNLTLLVWAGTAAVCLVVAYLVSRQGLGRDLATAFLSFGAFTTILALDDAFQIHELVVVRVTTSGEELMFGAYALILAALLVRHRSFVLRTPFALPALTGALLLVSAVFDRWIHGLHLIEDGAKFVAIVTWGTWLVGTGIAVLTRDV
jgi:hypothetical protein